MRVPFCKNAVVDIRKLTDYVLYPKNEIGKHKARVFASVLNLTIENAPILQAALLEVVMTIDAEIGKLDKYGQRYTVDFEFEWQSNRAIIRSG